MKNLVYISMIMLILNVSCVNDERDFPDFEYQTVYFAHQFPVRTITFGEDLFDNSLDNEGKVRVMATLGGAYASRSDVLLDIEVDNSLTENLLFTSGGEPVRNMPSEYFQLQDNQITIPRGRVTGGVEVQLTGAFFNDPDAIRNSYVIPLRITNVVNADSVLSGIPLVSNPNRAIISDWDVQPKDFVFYAIKYINEYDGNYLRRGADAITGKPGYEELTQNATRRANYVENDQIQAMNTSARNETILPLVYQGEGGVNVNLPLRLTFNNNGECTISAGADGFTASGSGRFVSKGEKNSWGGQDRDALYLTYEIDNPMMNIVTTDTLVMRDRGVGFELFNPVLQ
ncbi:DUF5627 domain-containing protein [Belliella marina]|uniref:DUF5627 domain-containing protein n=1 Tax=Belliella marina TaxID=1644146 RepID=A0ABW4VJ38_9BACT